MLAEPEAGQQVLGAARDLDVARRRDELTETIPASLSYEERLHFAPGQVHVISYDPARHLLFEVMP